MIAMLTDDRAFMSREWRMTNFAGSLGLVFDLVCKPGDMADWVGLVGAPVLSVGKLGGTIADVGQITSVNIEARIGPDLAVSLRVDRTHDRRPFREPFMPGTFEIPTDPDWYRIQADYWQDRGDPFAEPCRKFGEYLSEMFT